MMNSPGINNPGKIRAGAAGSPKPSMISTTSTRSLKQAIDSPGAPTGSKDDFWNTKFTFTHSTFGCSSKRATLGTDDPPGDGFRKKSDALDWIGKDGNGNNHARMRIALPVGKNSDYNPDYTKNSKREALMNITISDRFPDYEAQQQKDTIKFNKTVRKIEDMASAAARELHNIHQPKKKKEKKKKKSELSEISVDAIQKGLLPGPGSYDPRPDAAVKFDRAPKALMAPRERRSKSRILISMESLDIVDDRTKQGFSYGGAYDLQVDPLKKNPYFTIGKQRPVITLREVLPVGPGYYNDARAFPFLGPSALSTSYGTKK
jgi:hypothetical protein